MGARTLAAVAAGALAWAGGAGIAQASDLMPLKGSAGASTMNLKFDGQANTQLVARGGGGGGFRGGVARGGVAAGGFRGGVARGGFRGGVAVGGFRGGVVRAGSWGTWGRSPWVGWGRSPWVGWGRSPWIGWGRNPWIGWGRNPWIGWGGGFWPVFRPVIVVSSPSWDFSGDYGGADFGVSSYGAPPYLDNYSAPTGLRVIVPVPLPDANGTYPYDGGPSVPVPMPPPEPAPTSNPKRAAVPVHGRLVSLSAQHGEPATGFAYPAYGEEPRPTMFAADRVLTVKAR
jgi:hypothetical protein